MSNLRIPACLVLLLAPTGASAQSDDARDPDPRNFAQQVLKIYQAQDIGSLLALSPRGAPPPSVLKQFAPGTSRHNSLFGPSSWRWQSVAAWDGRLKDVRVKRSAMVAFHEDKNSGELQLAGWKQAARGEWKFDGLYDWPKVRLGAMGYELQKDAELQSAAEDETVQRDVRLRSLHQLQALTDQLLRAYQQKDKEAVLALSVDGGPLSVQYLSDEERQRPLEEFLFADEEMQAVGRWNGGPVNVYTGQTAYVEYGRAGGEVFVVVLPRRGGKWTFEDLNSPDIQGFESSGLLLKEEQAPQTAQ